jgi:predicted molibdopterin-dependent oxidoreductase YjgC
MAAALQKADLLVVQDIFPGPTTRIAHCVFPASSFAEKDGTMTNIEHRIQRLNQAIPPLGPSMPDWNILEQVAETMGRPMGFFNVSDVFREMALTIPFYKGLKFQGLQGDGQIVRPFAAGREGSRSGRRYSFAPVRTVEAPEKDGKAFPFEMMAGRSMYHFGSTSTRSRNLLGLCPEGYVEINPLDADNLEIQDGERVEVSSPIGSFVAPVKRSTKVAQGMVFVPANFPDLGVYRLFEENTTVCRVKLAAHRGEDQR